VAFVRFPASWYGDWHPTPRRQFFIFLAGGFVGETSDGDRRHFGAGSVSLLDDITGKGHRALSYPLLDVALDTRGLLALAVPSRTAAQEGEDADGE
jgi:hypothetical protein